MGIKSLKDIFEKLDKKLDNFYNKNKLLEAITYECNNEEISNKTEIIDKKGNTLELIYKGVSKAKI